MQNRRAPYLLLLLAFALLLQFGWRTYLAAQFALDTSLPQQSLTLLNWRLLDQFLGPTALILLALTEYLHTGSPAKPYWTALGVLLALALVSTALTIGSVSGLESALEVTAAVLLGLCVLALGPRSLFALSRTVAERGGFTIDSMWRLLTLQWLLVWVAAEVILRLNLRNAGGVSASERARNLLFALPAFALLPNILLSAGLHWLNPARLQTVRIRAWLVSMLALNVAILGVLAGEFANRWWTVAAVGPFLLGLVLYVLGFPRNTWKAPGFRLVLAAFAALSLGLLLAAVEHARAPTQPVLLREYAAGWRFLAGPAPVLLFLLGVATIWLNAAVADKYRGGRLKLAAILVTLLGLVLVPGAFLAAALLDRNSLPLTALGAVLLWIGLLLAASIGLRAYRSPAT